MIDRLTLGHDARSPQLCAKPLPVEHVLGTIAFRLRFGGILRGRFVLRTWFDRVPAGTVLAGKRLFRARSDYRKWCVPRTSVNARYVLADSPTYDTDERTLSFWTEQCGLRSCDTQRIIRIQNNRGMAANLAQLRELGVESETRHDGLRGFESSSVSW